MNTTAVRLSTVFCALFLGAQGLAAHDHWIAPTTFHPAVGERVDLRLCVGHPSRFEQQNRDSTRFVRFECFAPPASEPDDAAAQPIRGVEGKSPAGLWRAKEAGVHILVYESKHDFVEIEPDEYAAFLKEEGLEDIQAERERLGETERPGRDSYARYDKALIFAGPTGPGRASSAGTERAVGLPLELIPQTNPLDWKHGDELVLRLVLDGKPLANRQVKLMHLAEPHTILLARSDEQGRASFKPAETGGWVACAVHQRRATSAQELQGDWEGLWASLSFELPPGE